MMTNEQKQIAIAEFDGWKWSTSIDIGGVTFTECWSRDEHDFAWCPTELPDYLTSRDAICGAVGKLDEAQLAKYAEHLQDVCRHYCVGVVPDYRRHLVSLARLTIATPSQMADALLLTLGFEI